MLTLLLMYSVISFIIFFIYTQDIYLLYLTRAYFLYIYSPSL